MARIRVNDLKKTFFGKVTDVVAIKEMTFTVEDSEFTCLLGPSGCGKSTLLYILAGLVEPTSGIAEIQRTVEGNHPLANMVFQEFGLFPWRNVLDNVAFGPEIRRVPKSERLNIAQKYIEMVGLSGFEQSYPHQLSGGMKQRVGMARALSNDPEVLLMDEPFGALDAQTRNTMQVELQKIWEKSRKTVMFVTHSIEEAILLSDKIFVITARPGRVLEIIQVDLPRPREPSLVKEKRYTDLFAHIYELMRNENLKGNVGGAT